MYKSILKDYIIIRNDSNRVVGYLVARFFVLVPKDGCHTCFFLIYWLICIVIWTFISDLIPYPEYAGTAARTYLDALCP